jgi:hypothetical protein
VASVHKHYVTGVFASCALEELVGCHKKLFSISICNQN